MYVSEKVYFPQEKLQNFQNTFKPRLGKADCKVFWELKAGSNRIKPYSNKNKNHLLTCVPVVVCVFVLLCRPSQAPEEWARGPTGDVSTPEVNVMLSLRPTSAGTLPQATQLQRESGGDVSIWGAMSPAKNLSFWSSERSGYWGAPKAFDLSPGIASWRPRVGSDPTRASMDS